MIKCTIQVNGFPDSSPTHSSTTTFLKSYAAPRLWLYGTIRRLTTGGTGMVSESNLPASDPWRDTAIDKCNKGLPFTGHRDYKHCR